MQTRIQDEKSLPLLFNHLTKFLSRVKFASRLLKTSKFSRQRSIRERILTLVSFSRLLKQLSDKLRSFKMKSNSRKRKVSCNSITSKRKRSIR